MIVETIEITIAATIAVKKESIEKPDIIWAARYKSTAFMTKINSPRVTIVAGRVKKISKGLTNIFKIPKTI